MRAAEERAAVGTAEGREAARAAEGWVGMAEGREVARVAEGREAVGAAAGVAEAEEAVGAEGKVNFRLT